MTKLKTVKDLGNDVNWIGRLILKKEAIKWIKPLVNVEHVDLGMELWIRFFNITEEDLK